MFPGVMGMDLCELDNTWNFLAASPHHKIKHFLERVNLSKYDGQA